MPQKTTNVVLDTNTKVTKSTLDKVPRAKKNPDLSFPDDGAIIATTKKSKELANRENISSAFNDLINMVETEIKDARDSSSKTCDIKFLRSVNKSIKTLRAQCERAIKKTSTSTTRQNNHNSGLQKPVKLSSELAKFTGWPEDELHSRVDVTKYICDYIATNKLQNPEDKRQIWPDDKLQKLLGFNPEKADKPLYYYGIQTYLKNQNHFPKDVI
jgi:chromatin remodeling complex protein RSC6